MLKSMPKSKNRYFYHILVFPGDAPGAITLNVGWKENSMLTNCLAACTHLSSTVSQLFEPQVQKVAIFTYRSPNFCFPWRRPYDYHAILRKSKNRYFYHIFVSPGDAPGAITLNVVWMEREFDAYKLSCCMCPSRAAR